MWDILGNESGGGMGNNLRILIKILIKISKACAGNILIKMRTIACSTTDFVFQIYKVCIGVGNHLVTSHFDYHI